MSHSSNTSTNCKKIIRIGSRKSKLALIQTEIVINKLKKYYNDEYEFEIVSMTTTGDHILDLPLSQIGEKSLFTRELEEQLLNNNIDFIVHSLKDLSTSLPNGCCISAILERENPNDVVVFKKDFKFENPFEAVLSNNDLVIGTSSLRRIALLKSLNPNLKIIDIRGNLNTRLSKLDKNDSDYSALILAYAGLKRGEFESRISYILNNPQWFHAVGQGALAIESRVNDKHIINLLKPLVDKKATFECLAERTFMKILEGGCSVPIGVRCSWQNKDNNENLLKNTLCLHGIVLSLDGREKVQDKLAIDLDQIQTESNNSFDFTGIISTNHDSENELIRSAFINCHKLGYDLAQNLLNKGAQRILNSLRK